MEVDYKKLGSTDKLWHISKFMNLGLTPEEIERDKILAEYISTINNYIPIQTENSVGGYSDWAGLYLKVPAFTIEIGPASAPTPIPLEYVEDAYIRNRDVPEMLLKRLNEELLWNLMITN